MMKAEDDVEIHDDPAYDYGAKVVATRHIRNDGTFPGAEIGEILVCIGDVGYVSSIGTFLQRYYIYGADFYERGRLVGMRAREIKPAEESQP